jgi:hypothetical protein
MPSKSEDMGGGEASSGKSSMPKDADSGKAAAGAETGKDQPKAAGSEDMPSQDKSAKTKEPKADTKGAAAEEETKSRATESDSKTGADTKAATKSKEGATDDEKTGAKAKTSTEAEGEAGATAKGEADTEAGATAEGKAGKSVRLESQQVTKVKTYFSEHRPTVKAIDKDEVSVSIGVALPGTIVLYELPPDIIVVEGACPVKYFVWGDDIVLVDSCTREVVEIIVGVA